MRRSMMGRKKLQLFTKRFYPAGNYTWIVPKGCREVDVFLVGAGGGSYHVTSMGWSGGGGGGYGGGAGSNIYINDKTQSLKGGDGTVLIRYWAYEE